MSDWKRRLQEMGLVAIIVLLALTVWILVEWGKGESNGTECIILNEDGEQIIRRGKQCSADELF